MLVKEGVPVAECPQPGLDPFVVFGIGEDEVALAVRQPQDRQIVDHLGVLVQHEAKLAIARRKGGNVTGHDLLQRCLSPITHHLEQAAIA